MPSQQEPMIKNELTKYEVKNALCFLEYCISLFSNASVKEYLRLDDELCFTVENVEVSISNANMEVSVYEAICENKPTTLRFYEFAGFRMDPSPTNIVEIVTRLRVWTSEIKAVTPQKVVERINLEANAAIDAASAAATVKDEHWSILSIYRPSPDTVQLQTYGGQFDGIYDADDPDKAVCHGAMSEPLSIVLNSMPYYKHIEIHDVNAYGIMTYYFWPYQQTLVNNTAPPLDKMRAIVRAEENNFKLLDSSIVW